MGSDVSADRRFNDQDSAGRSLNLKPSSGRSITDRQRFIATLTFEKPDRVPFMPGNGRESTRAAWRRQGLPDGVEDYRSYVRELIGIELEPSVEKTHPDVSMTMIPEFEEKIIEERVNSRVVQDWKGNVCEIAKNYDPSYLRGAPDFVTRTWIKCPVTCRDDWPDMARRYDADDPRRLPNDFGDRCRRMKDRTYVVQLSFPGPFWQLREWVGFENLCMLFLDDPDFVREMIQVWQDFVARMLERQFEHYVPDLVMVSEDMAYKQKPMIGPDMCRQFLLPCWQHWARICRGAGVPVYGIDSDGHIGMLLPLWIEGGFCWNIPVEVAAGNDLPAYRGQFGTRMAYSGGVDKRAIAAGGQTLRDELARLQPVIDSGGYIPGCDHAVPADVSWPNYVDYCRLLAGATGWL